MVEKAASQQRQQEALARLEALRVIKTTAFAYIFNIVGDTELSNQYLKNKEVSLLQDPKTQKNWPIINDMTPVIQYLSAHAEVRTLNFKEFGALKDLQN